MQSISLCCPMPARWRTNWRAGFSVMVNPGARDFSSAIFSNQFICTTALARLFFPPCPLWADPRVQTLLGRFSASQPSTHHARTHATFLTRPTHPVRPCTGPGSRSCLTLAEKPKRPAHERPPPACAHAATDPDRPQKPITVISSGAATRPRPRPREASPRSSLWSPAYHPPISYACQARYDAASQLSCDAPSMAAYRPPRCVLAFAAREPRSHRPSASRFCIPGWTRRAA